MVSENLSLGWYADSSGQKKRGGQMIYSDEAILSCLKIRYLFGLKIRQTQGFINWIFLMSGMKLTCPDYTTLSRRGKKLGLALLHESFFDYTPPFPQILS
jgi:hypothetical protein